MFWHVHLSHALSSTLPTVQTARVAMLGHLRNRHRDFNHAIRTHLALKKGVIMKQLDVSARQHPHPPPTFHSSTDVAICTELLTR